MNYRLIRSLAFAACAGVSLATGAQSTAAAPSLFSYYTYHPVPGTFEAVDPPQPGLPPSVRVIGGGVDPAPIVTNVGSYASIQRMLRAVWLTNLAGYPYAPRYMYLLERREGTCPNTEWSSFVPIPRIAGEQYTATVAVNPPLTNGECQTSFFGGRPLFRWDTTDRVTFLAPIRRTAIDGSEYDASPMVVERAGVPWMTYYAGYRLGFVAGESNWLASNAAQVPALAGWPSLPNARDNFELVKLPPPFVEGEMIEYFTGRDFPGTGNGRFGYAAIAEQQKVFDASAEWFRTGKSFKTGGYVAACALSTNAALETGTVFYSANAKECTMLAALPVFPAAATPFHTSLPIPAASPGGPVTCPAATIPLYRLFNNGFGLGKGLGHRYLTSNAVRQTMIRSAGWIDEGIVMCVPE